MPVIDLGSVVGPQGPQGVAGQTGATGATGSPGPNQITGSTSTTLNGILQGNGSAVSAVASDATPTSGSTNIVRSGVVFDSLQKKSNRNLLTNWYFIGGGTGYGVFPINTRGESEYVGTSGAMTIDRWNKTSDIKVYLQAARLALGGPSGGANLRYYFPATNAFAGLTLTFSFLLSGDTGTSAAIGFYTGSNSYSSVEDLDSNIILIKHTYTVPAAFSGQLLLMMRGYYPTTASRIYLYAAKLEVGEMSTLAHQENGVWVLNDVPDYDEELLATYTFGDTSDEYGSHLVAFEDMIAPVEKGKNASRQYTTGQLFCWHGYLYRATTTINSGVAFVEGTNCVQTTLAAEMNL